MKKLLKVVVIAVALIVVAAAAFYAWAASAASRHRSRVIATHTVDFPIPFPLSAEEIRRRRLSPEAAARVAREEAVERGRHLVRSRYACIECHGQDFSGGIMVDAPPIGRMHGPNLTGGRGSRTGQFTPADWDRIVRHGVLPGGPPAAMPSEDFQGISDQELSDVIVYAQSFPPVDNQEPPVTLGPVGKILMALGKMPFSADLIESHDTPHATYPPEPAPTAEYGRYVGAMCTGCHRPDLGGGPIAGGDPSWPPAQNITPDATGLADWTQEQFFTLMREGRRPDGTDVQMPMSKVTQFVVNMTEVEMEALWKFVQSVPPVSRTN